MSSLKTNTHYVPIITFLRAIACLGVCFVHMFYATNPAFGPFLTRVVTSGQQGVPVFFVISGFIIPYSLWNSGYHTKDFFSYIFKRSVRIDPPYLAVVFLSIIELFFRKEAFDLLRFLYHLLYLIPFTSKTWYQGIFWTLGIEFQFYLIIGLTFSYIKNKNPILISCILLLLSFICTSVDTHKSSSFIISHAHCFCIGIICLLSKKGRISLAITHILLLSILIFLGIKVSITTGLVPYLTALLILHVNFQTRVTNFLGKISYSVYVTHLFSGAAILNLLQGSRLNPAILFVLSVAGCILFGYLFYRIIEKPAIQWSQSFGKKDRI